MKAMEAIKNLAARAAAAILAAGALAAATAPAARADELDYGKPGDPVHLVVGYQPFYTESWSSVVVRGRKLYEKYLPKGSTVDFQMGLQGAIIVNAMLAGKEHIGYLGDVPAIVSTTKQQVADIRIVASIGLGHDQCNVLLTRTDAPAFPDAETGIKWLEGKRVAVPTGSCADRFAQASLRKHSVKPESYLNQSIEVITSNFRAGKIDASVVWEPVASRLVAEGLARRVATGFAVGETDGAFLTMRADLIKSRPDVVKAWLNAELDAEQYLADPKNAAEVASMAAEYATGYTDKVLWTSLYGRYPDTASVASRVTIPFAITPEVTALIAADARFLNEIKTINVDTLRPDAVMPEFAQAALKERGLSTPVAKVPTLDDKDYKGK